MPIHPKRKGVIKRLPPVAAEIVQNMLRDGLIVDAKVTNMSASKLTAGNLAVQILFTVGGSVATAASGARVDIVPAGIKVYDSGGTQRGQILSDGSGWFGGSTDFSWTTAGAVSINGAKIQDLTVGTLQINNTTVTNAKIATVYAVGANLLCSNDSVVEIGSVTDYTKSKEIYLPFAGSLRIYFELKTTDVSQTIYGKIYRNGNAVGTERSTNSINYTAFSEDITGWSIGDFVQLYLKSPNSTTTEHARNFRLKVDYSSLLDPINTVE